jgi:hypothetical protein
MSIYLYICRWCDQQFQPQETESDAWADGVDHYNHTQHEGGDVKEFEGGPGYSDRVAWEYDHPGQTYVPGHHPGYGDQADLPEHPEQHGHHDHGHHEHGHHEHGHHEHGHHEQGHHEHGHHEHGHHEHGHHEHGHHEHGHHEHGHQEHHQEPHIF